MVDHADTSYLFLGSGNFSSPFGFAWEHSQYSAQKAHDNGIDVDPENNPAARELVGIVLTATEYRTAADAIETYQALIRKNKTQNNPDNAYYRYFDNKYGIQNMGGTVVEGFDATNYPPGTGSFDHIIFENAHTDAYGAIGDDLKNLEALQSNRALVTNAMLQARGHLNTNGTFELIICGWPFQSRRPKGQGMEWEQGMELDRDGGARQLAGNGGMRFVRREPAGRRWIERNNGEGFGAEATRLVFTL
ncbi:hypothetical protein OQA88_5361 [Cercophora sp. LCS_1]